MRPPRALIVDDEPKIRDLVSAYFTADGFDIREAEDGETGLRLIDSFTPDIVILDVMLPGIDGVEVLRRLRMSSDAYVIMLTARAEETDKLVGLAVGADDYVTKPFSPRELLARAKAMMRRTRAGTSDADVIDTPRLRVDRSRREVRCDGRPVDVTTLEFDLLEMLAASPGRVFSRRQMLERVWGYDFFGDERVVDVHIGHLRKSLGDDASAPEIIGTVRGVGYKLLDGGSP